MAMAWGDNSERIILRLPPETKRVLERMARKARQGKGLTLSEYVRELLIQHVEKVNERNG